MTEKHIQLNVQTAASLDELLRTYPPANYLGTPRQRAMEYVVALLAHYRDRARKPKFHEPVVASLEDLLQHGAGVPATAALGLQYLREQVAHYNSPEAREAREREVRRVQSYRHKEMES